MITFSILILCLAATRGQDQQNDMATTLTPPPELWDARHGIVMGVPNGGCDDAQTNLFIDWNGNAVNYTCFTPNAPYFPNPDVPSILTCNDSIPSDYYPQHHCMLRTIEYDEPLPVIGDHRPLWPRYGEYRFVPRQRWLHNIEHGAVVMLYHPCALASEVDQLRKIVTSCIKKHIISPITFLTKDRPLALVAWGCRLTMSSIDETEVVQFIRNYGMKAPEGQHPGDGQYDLELIRGSAPKDGNMNNEALCPDHN